MPSGAGAKPSPWRSNGARSSRVTPQQESSGNLLASVARHSRSVASVGRTGESDGGQASRARASASSASSRDDVRVSLVRRLSVGPRAFGGFGQNADVRARLDSAHATGARFRRTVQLPLLAWSGVLSCGGFALALVLLAHDQLDLELQLAFQLIMFGCFVQLFALLPTDKLFIDLVAMFEGSAGSVWVLVCLGVTALELRRGSRIADDPLAAPAPYGMYESGCGSGLPAVRPCWWPYAIAARTFAWAALVAYFVGRVGVLCVPWPSCVRRALCLGELRSSRARLDVQWHAKGVVTAGSCCASALTLGLKHALMPSWVPLDALAGDAALLARARRERALVIGAWLGTLLQGSVALCCFIPRVRVRLMAFLAARSESLNAAAGIAALLGGREPAAVQKEAEGAFRYVTLDRLSKDELAQPTPDPVLYARSVPAAFGEVDAFVSHSWSDSAGEKWEALQAWRAQFKMRCGREPKLWLDKCCIDQRNIEQNLACLPVFLAGCHTLLIFAGETYLTRLWCVIELAVFLEMGGELHRIAFVPLGLSREPRGVPAEGAARGGGGGGGGGAHGASGMAAAADAVLGFDEEAADAEPPGPRPAHAPRTKSHSGAYASLEQRVRHFDVTAAQCSNPLERERLLAMVEQGFGGMSAFDQSLRVVLEPLILADAPQAASSRHAAHLFDPGTTIERAMAAAERAAASAAAAVLASRGHDEGKVRPGARFGLTPSSRRQSPEALVGSASSASSAPADASMAATTRIQTLAATPPTVPDAVP